jgi:hypothetical protein
MTITKTLPAGAADAWADDEALGVGRGEAAGLTLVPAGGGWPWLQAAASQTTMESRRMGIAIGP